MTEASTSTARVPWGDPRFRTVVASTLVAVLGIAIVTPIVPLLPDVLGVSDRTASLLITAYTLPGIFLSPVAGVLADRYGRRRVLVGSLLVFALSGLAILVPMEFGVVLVLRAVQGTGAAGLFSIAITVIGDSYQGAQRNAALGANSAAISIGAAVYPLVGGALAAAAWNAPFVLYGTGLLVAGYAARTLDDREAAAVGGFAYLRGAARALPVARAVVLYGTATGIAVLLFGGVFTAIPFVLRGEFRLSASAIGAVLTASALSTTVSASLSGRLARRFDNGQLMALGLAGYALGLGVAFAAGSIPGVVASVLVVGMGQGVVFPALDSTISDLAPDAYRAGALSLRTSSLWLGTTVGPVLFTTLAVTTGYRPLLAGAALVALALALVARQQTAL